MAKGTATYDFEDARVLVTGGTSGIGLATAKAFKDAGAQVVITGTRTTSTDYDIDLSGLTYRQLDIENTVEILALADGLDGLDVLVNNAGSVRIAAPDEAIDAFEQMVRQHLFAAHHLSDACLELLTQSSLPGGASVVGIASLTSYMANPFAPGYGAGKAGMMQLARSQATLWAPRGIRSNCVAAGNTATRMTAPMVEMEALSATMMERTALKRWGQPEEIADAVLFLSSDRAAFITGETVLVDGGYLFNM